VVPIRIPPLRERPDDVPALAKRLLERHARRSAVPAPILGADAVRALCKHPWRGNVRELANVLERALMLVDEGRIGIEHLPPDVRTDVASHLDLEEAIDRFERGYIAMALKLCGGSREKAAEELGISPATLYRRLERFRTRGTSVGPARSG
jgi:transcriptional regulator of aroF, aroG, tyrA and aromatic amino acid transport